MDKGRARSKQGISRTAFGVATFNIDHWLLGNWRGLRELFQVLARNIMLLRLEVCLQLLGQASHVVQLRIQAGRWKQRIKSQFIGAVARWISSVKDRNRRTHATRIADLK